MSWQDEVDELNRQEQLAREMGGKEGIDFQHGRGKLTVRERIDLLADENSFHEVGTLTGTCLLYTSPSPRDLSTSRMPSSA